MEISLVMVKGDGTRRDFPITKNRVVVGRTNTCDLRVPLPSVSRQHCEIVVDGAQVKLRDLGSSNGTYHNNIRVQEATLRAGDEVGVGPVILKVSIDGKMGDAKAPAGGKPVAAPVAANTSTSGAGAVKAPSAGKPPVAPAAAKAPPSKPAAKPPVKGQPIARDDSGEDLPTLVDDESHSPTTDLDDPIAALEALAQAEDGTVGEVELLDDKPSDKAKPGAKK